ncbi:MAG: ThiF family adenylyltransferase [Burkholderiaceae bacterium]
MDDRAFSGVSRLLGEERAQRLSESHVVVVGLGGVGSWAAEALVRSGVGHITLIDMDHVAASNLNRQVHALTSTVGASKIVVMSKRIADINPACQVGLVDDFVTTRNVGDLIPDDADAVIDAIDQTAVKAAIVAMCRNRGQWVLVCGAAGALTDPLALERADLGRAESDPMLARLRKRLRREYGFERGRGNRLGIATIFSREHARAVVGEVAGALPGAADLPASPLACAGYGSIVTVTAAMGMAAAADTITFLQDKPGHSGAQCHPPGVTGVVVPGNYNKTNRGPDQPAQPLENT